MAANKNVIALASLLGFVDAEDEESLAVVHTPALAATPNGAVDVACSTKAGPTVIRNPFSS